MLGMEAAPAAQVSLPRVRFFHYDSLEKCEQLVWDKLSKDIPTHHFPTYGGFEAKPYLDELKRLVSPSLFLTEYMDARSGASLLACALRSYRSCLSNPRWASSPILSKLASHPHAFNLVCSALFDLVCNAEYIRGRVINRNWIYCNRQHGTGASDIHAYYSYLKQCPHCCQDRGLEPRLTGAQHKPSSHHIGEITTTSVAFFLTMLGMSGPKPLRIGVISKQSHDVDALAWRDDLLVLFEIKASPLLLTPYGSSWLRHFSKTVMLVQKRLGNID